MKEAIVYPGSFDPITKGHVDIIKRAAGLTDKLIIGVLNNSAKKCWFTPEERKAMIEQSLGEEVKNVEVKIFNGLLVDFMAENNVKVILRGLRTISDYEYELQLAIGNSTLSRKTVETVFIPASQEYAHLSSSMVREVAINNGLLDMFVSSEIIPQIQHRVAQFKD